MAETTKTPFELEMDARIEKAKENLRVEHPDMFAPMDAPSELPIPTATDVTPAIEAAPADAPPPVETPPAEVPAPIVEPTPEAVPVAATPEVVAPETQRADGVDWRQYRKQERELRRLNKELEAIRAGKAPAAPAEQPAPVAPTQQPPAFTDDDDPFGVARIERQQQQILAEQQSQRVAFEEERLRAEVSAQESTFRQAHPDYDTAIDHLVNAESRRYRNSGLAVVHGNLLMNDAKFGPIVEKIADDYVAVADAASPIGVRYYERAKATGPAREISDQEAAQLLATDMWIGERRSDLLRGARASGKAVPEVVYQVARDMGYTPQQAREIATQQPGAPIPIAPAAPAPTVGEKIRAQAKAAAAGKSLSSVTSGGATEAGAPQIRTLAELNAFRLRDPQGHRQYMAEMASRNPNWHRDLVG